MKKVIFLINFIALTIGCKNSDIIYNPPVPEHDSLTTRSKFVNKKRIINIWNPPNYNKSYGSILMNLKNIIIQSLEQQNKKL